MSNRVETYLCKEVRRNILYTQDNRCYWCGREFGTAVVKPDNTLYVLTPVWDHYIPYSYTCSNKPSEFIASCSRCNLHKSSFIITSEESENELRERLVAKWFKGGWLDIDLAIIRNLELQNDDEEDFYDDFDEYEENNGSNSL